MPTAHVTLSQARPQRHPASAPILPGPLGATGHHQPNHLRPWRPSSTLASLSRPDRLTVTALTRSTLADYPLPDGAALTNPSQPDPQRLPSTWLAVSRRVDTPTRIKPSRDDLSQRAPSLRASPLPHQPTSLHFPSPPSAHLGDHPASVLSPHLDSASLIAPTQVDLPHLLQCCPHLTDYSSHPTSEPGDWTERYWSNLHRC